MSVRDQNLFRFSIVLIRLNEKSTSFKAIGGVVISRKESISFLEAFIFSTYGTILPKFFTPTI
jgi:hypothetical protein